jgi:uncharacterized membrane protein
MAVILTTRGLWFKFINQPSAERAMKRAVISILSALAFAAVLAFFPGEYFTALLLYLLFFFGISVFLGLRTYRQGVAAAREIAKGKPLLEIDEKEVNKLLEKDKELVKEYKKFVRTSFMPLLMLPIFLLLFMILFPALPHLAESALEPYVGAYLARFLGYATIFVLFAAISLVIFKPQAMPRIVRNLKVYETGLVIDKVLGLKSPIEVSEYKVNEERKFIEFKTNNQIFRIYYKDIKELDAVLSKLIKPSKQ